MTNTKELLVKITENQYTIESLSKVLKIHKKTLKSMIYNTKEFSQKNIIDIKNILKLTNEETIDIFLT